MPGTLFKALLLCLALLSTALSASAQHQPVPGWPALPPDEVLGLCSAVGVDSHNQVFVFHRRGRQWTNPLSTEPIPEATVTIIDGPSGKCVSSWGSGLFALPHGLTVDQKDNIWLTDVALHQVYKFTHDGHLLMTLGERGHPGDDHAHFNLPTGVAVLPDGSFYVSDGYKNTRVVKFSATGEYQFEWGGKGSEPGQFRLPHGIALGPQGKVYVCDRSNSRLQVFDVQGHFLDQWQGPHIGRPYGVATDGEGHVFEVDGGEPSLKSALRGKVVELDAQGKVLDTFGSHGAGLGQFRTGHGIAVGPDGAVYVADSGGKRVVKFAKKPAAAP